MKNEIDICIFCKKELEEFEEDVCDSCKQFMRIKYPTTKCLEEQIRCHKRNAKKRKQ